MSDIKKLAEKILNNEDLFPDNVAEQGEELARMVLDGKYEEQAREEQREKDAKIVETVAEDHASLYGADRVYARLATVAKAIRSSASKDNI